MPMSMYHFVYVPGYWKTTLQWNVSLAGCMHKMIPVCQNKYWIFSTFYISCSWNDLMDDRNTTLFQKEAPYTFLGVYLREQDKPSRITIWCCFLYQAMETQLAQERIEVDHLQGLLKAAKEKAEHDKEALKKATRWGSCSSMWWYIQWGIMLIFRGHSGDCYCCPGTLSFM